MELRFFIIKKILKPRTSLIPRSSNRPLSGQIHDCPGYPHHCSGFFNHAMSFTSSLALSSPVLPASQCNIRHLFCAECKMLSWLRRGSRKGLFCHFWQLHHWSAERTWEWPAVSSPSPPPPRLMPKPHGSWCLSPSPPGWLPSCSSLSMDTQSHSPSCLYWCSNSICLLMPSPPQICLLGLLVPQPSDTSIRVSRSPPHTSARNFFAHLCGLSHLPSASCFLLVQQLEISSGLCKPATFSATHWPAVMPDPTRSKF